MSLGIKKLTAMKIAFFDRAFTENKGGIERVCSGVIQEMTVRGHQCVVFAANKNSNASAVFPVPGSTKIINISINNFEEDRWKFESKVLEEKPDVFVIMTGRAGNLPLWCLLALKNTNIPIVASEHHCPEFVEQGWNRRERLVYLNSVDCIHLLLKSYRESLPNFLQDKVAVIPNPVNPMPLQVPAPPQTSAEKIIIAVGTLYAKQPKQMHFLVEAFALLKNEFPDWKVHIYGSGPDKKKLERLINRRRLNGRIILCGVTNDIEGQLKTAQLFCMPSSHEGCPCALQEAMTYGLPSVGFAECPGVNELIVDGETGLLAENMTIDSLSNALGQLMGNSELRTSMGDSANRMSKEFLPEDLYDKWENVLNEASRKSGHTMLLTSHIEFEGPDGLRFDLERMARRKHLCSDEWIDNLLSSRFWRYLVLARSVVSKLTRLVPF